MKKCLFLWDKQKMHLDPNYSILYYYSISKLLLGIWKNMGMFRKI